MRSPVGRVKSKVPSGWWNNRAQPASRSARGWDAAAVRAQLVAALTAAHAIGRSPPIELGTAFAEAEQRARPGSGRSKSESVPIRPGTRSLVRRSHGL